MSSYQCASISSYSSVQYLLCRFSLTDSGVTLAIRMLKGSTAAQDQGSQQSHDQLSQRSQPLSKSTVVASARKPQLPTESKKQKKTPPILLGMELLSLLPIQLYRKALQSIYLQAVFPVLYELKL